MSVFNYYPQRNIELLRRQKMISPYNFFDFLNAEVIIRQPVFGQL
jgi:hypothetical protein